MVSQFCEYTKSHWTVYILFLFFLATPCGMWDPSPLTRHQTPALEVQALNHWTITEVPFFLSFSFFMWTIF